MAATMTKQTGRVVSCARTLQISLVTNSNNYPHPPCQTTNTKTQSRPKAKTRPSSENPRPPSSLGRAAQRTHQPQRCHALLPRPTMPRMTLQAAKKITFEPRPPSNPLLSSARVSLTIQTIFPACSVCKIHLESRVSTLVQNSGSIARNGNCKGR